MACSAFAGKISKCSRELEQWILDNAPNYNIQGLSLTVMLKDGEHCNLYYGYRKSDEKLRVTSNTLFNAASISKPLTAYAALMVFSKLSLDINAPINNFLSSWTIKSRDGLTAEKVSLSNLLSHSAGITGFRCIGYGRNQSFPSLQNALNGKPPANTPAVVLVSRPDTRFLYSPAGYMIVEQAIEDIENKSFYQIMNQELLKPLQMYHSTFIQPLPRSSLNDIAWPYLPNGQRISNGPLSFIAATGGLWTTTEDLSKFLRAIQRSYHNQPHSFLDNELTKTYLSPHFSNNWGLGMQINFDKNGIEKKTGNYFGHGGFNSGYLSFMLASKNDAVGFVVMINTAPLMTTKGEVVQFDFIKKLNSKIANLYSWH